MSRGLIPGSSRNFSLLHVIQTGSWAHPAFYPKGIGGFFSGIKRVGREADHSHLVARSIMVKLYLHSPIRLHGVLLS
jgi:hypothetical protein